MLTSLVGYSLTYNTLDNNRIPTSGIIVDFKQDFAGVGGDVNFIKSTVDLRHYTRSCPTGSAWRASRAVTPAAGVAKTCACSIISRAARTSFAASQPAGFGPRDLTPGTNTIALGGSILLGCDL